jgi:hypothetical protein
MQFAVLKIDAFLLQPQLLVPEAEGQLLVAKKMRRVLRVMGKL